MEQPQSAGLTLPPDRAEVAHARRFMAEQCLAFGLDSATCETAVLLISETVTNAFIHGRSEARILLTRTSDRVRVAVSDDNSRHPAFALHDLEALDGRGMTIVELLAAQWGVERDVLGKTVWFELAVSGPGGPAGAPGGGAGDSGDG